MLSDNDAMGAPPVALINEALARREFLDEDPIGRRILAREIVVGSAELGQEIAWEIVGVIAGEKITGIGDEIGTGMYVSNQQSPTYGIDLIMRADIPPQSLQRAVRSAIDNVNRDQALSDVRTLEQIVNQSMLANRVVSTLLAAFASLALLLAAVGIYGVISYTTAQRTHEMGIRAALGASAGNLRRLVLQDGTRLTLAGLALGLVGTLAATRVLSSMLYDVDALDPLTIVVVAVLLSGVAGLACFIPAWRMTKTDPMEALRYR
jgi:putative ABC transport system permease protein